jgi:serine/threonine protein kinase/tetratricopeptide (TPR) repeat protein
LYEQLSPEEAAHIDAVCDRFEKAWKETKAGASEPQITSYLTDSDSSAREVLFRELDALDQACRKRYGFAARADTREPGAAPRNGTTSVMSPSGSPAPVNVGWPSIPGLEFVEVLGSGGMGVVFRARQATLDRDVAVKVLRDPHHNDTSQRERFLQEARAVARLRHPNLVQLYEFGEVPAAGGTTQPYLLLEYISGGSLADLLHRAPQHPRDAAQLVETLAQAIHYAHQQGVIHRDLKPANVLLTNGESAGNSDTLHLSPLTTRQPKISDFGLAKFLAGGNLTRSGDVLGTPSYMAPEQAASNCGPITASADVYGLGAILYESLTGRPPFAAETTEATLLQVMQDEPVPPRRLQPTVPRDLETICLKCLRKEVGRRYASAQELADDLRRFRTGEPIRARPVGTVERVVVWCRRKPVVAALLAALVLVILTGSAGVLWQWHRATTSAAEAEENAAAYLRERDTARQEKERAERHLRIVHDRVKELEHLGRDLLQQPGKYKAGQAMLEQALGFYKDLLPEEGHDPKVRHKAAKLYRQVANIYSTLGLAVKAEAAFDNEARLLDTLLKNDPGSKALRFELADSQRWRGNVLRDLNKPHEALAAYNQATSLQEELLSESPNDADHQVALANTLLNKATLLSYQADAKELDEIFQRILKLERAALGTLPDNPEFSAELAIALGDQAQFFLVTGRGPQGKIAACEALEIYQKLMDGGRLKGSIERYAARGFVILARVHAAAGQVEDAEESYQKAVSLLDQLVKELPESALRRADQADALVGLADFYKVQGRQADAEKIRRRVIRRYEALKADFPGDPQYRLALMRAYLELASLLWQLDQQSEAADLFRKALQLDPNDRAINNELARFLATVLASSSR